MDKLLRAAEFYRDNLAGRKYHLIAGKSGKKIEFDIAFNEDNFKHLLGLHKLIDIRISRLSSENGYREILNGRTSLADIEKSKYYEQVEERLDNFNEIKSTLNSKELLIKSLHGEFNFIRADFMLTNRNEEYGYAHLFLKEKGNSITVPVTFIIHPDNSYLRNNPDKWTVLSIEEVKK